MATVDVPLYISGTTDESQAAVDQTTNQTLSSLQSQVANPTPVNYVAPTESEKIAAGVVTPDASKFETPNTTVAGQLNQLLSSDSEYMKQAAAKSKITANELGMLSSDRFIGASQGAAIREALPIATADASSAAKFGLQQQQSENQLAATSLDLLGSGALKTQQAQIDAQAKKTQAAIDTVLQSGLAKNNMELANLNTKLTTASQETLKEFDAKINKDLLAVEYDEKTAENLRAQAVSQIENTMISIENILKSPDILQLGSGAMSTIINNEIHLLKGGIELSYNLAKLNVDSYVSNLLSTYEQQYKFYGY